MRKPDDWPVPLSWGSNPAKVGNSGRDGPGRSEQPRSAPWRRAARSPRLGILTCHEGRRARQRMGDGADLGQRSVSPGRGRVVAPVWTGWGARVEQHSAHWRQHGHRPKWQAGAHWRQHGHRSKWQAAIVAADPDASSIFTGTDSTSASHTVFRLLPPRIYQPDLRGLLGELLARPGEVSAGQMTYDMAVSSRSGPRFSPVIWPHRAGVDRPRFSCDLADLYVVTAPSLIGSRLPEVPGRGGS